MTVMVQGGHMLYYSRMTDVGHDADTVATPRQTRIEYVVLCDSAQTTQEGKLYVLGGGWSHIFRVVPPPGASVTPPPTQFAIAASFLIDWLDANRPIGIRVTIEHQDEQAPLYEAKAQLTAGRPPIAAPGDPLRALIALPVLMTFPAAGAYCARAQMEGAATEEVVRFRVTDAMMPTMPAANPA
jgi:hypothetical protein